LTVSFRDELTVDRLRSLAALVRSGAMSARDRRNEQVVADAAFIPSILRNAVPAVHVPSDRRVAAALLQRLYESGADDVSGASERLSSWSTDITDIAGHRFELPRAA
jgi:hypothetical protein